MSNRADFLEMREQEAFNNPQDHERPEEKPTLTQSYHSGGRKEGDPILMNNGYYRIDYDNHHVLFILEKYNYNFGFWIHCEKAIHSSNPENVILKAKFKTDTLRRINPASHEEKEVLLSISDNSLIDLAKRDIAKHGLGNGCGLKAILTIDKPLGYHNNAKPLKAAQKLRYYPEYKPSREPLMDYELEKFLRNERKNI